MVLENQIPTIDLKSGERSELATQIVSACEDFGFFKVVNHDVGFDVIQKLEAESKAFFAKPDAQKKLANAKPFGYGCKNIGSNGDTGEVEYILLRANPKAISDSAKTISDDPTKFSSAAIGYVDAVKGLACRLLDLIAEGLQVPDTKILSSLIKEAENDSLFRVNHYPPVIDDQKAPAEDKIGFGEHSDPQILTILRSNDIPGLVIRLRGGGWAPVAPDPTAFFVNVGDLLEVMTNGRFLSVRHKAVVGSEKMRMSVAFFASPALHANITELPYTDKMKEKRVFREFTWQQYKGVTYALRLAAIRLDKFMAIDAPTPVPLLPEPPTTPDNIEVQTEIVEDASELVPN